MGLTRKELLRIALESEAGIILVDTIRSLFQLKDENDNAEVARALGEWEGMLQSRGCTRIYVHHNSKAGGEHGTAVAGAGGFVGIVDRVIDIR
jgi:RecA-family ATPase